MDNLHLLEVLVLVSLVFKRSGWPLCCSWNCFRILLLSVEATAQGNPRSLQRQVTPLKPQPHTNPSPWCWGQKQPLAPPQKLAIAATTTQAMLNQDAGDSSSNHHLQPKLKQKLAAAAAAAATTTQGAPYPVKYSKTYTLWASLTTNIT